MEAQYSNMLEGCCCWLRDNRRLAITIMMLVLVVLVVTL